MSNAFQLDTARHSNRVRRRRRIAAVIRVLTFNFVDLHQWVAQAEAALAEAKEVETRYVAATESAAQAASELANPVRSTVVRLSASSASVVGVLGAETYGPHWDSITRAVRERDDHTCREADARCSGPLQVHHLVPLSRGGRNEIDNLVTVCRFHHSLHHPHMRR